MKSAPTRIREAIEAKRFANSFNVVNGIPTNKAFMYVVGGYVSFDESEGEIVSVDPIVINKTKGDDTIDDSTLFYPLYPYVSVGSVIEGVNSTTPTVMVDNLKDYPLIVVNTIDRRETKTSLDMMKYDAVIDCVVDSNYEMNGSVRYAVKYDDYLLWVKDFAGKAMNTIGMFNNIGGGYYERWGNAQKYGRTDENVFNNPVDCYELTGDLTYDQDKTC